MIDRRRCPSPTPPSIQCPSPSGPRCATASVIRLRTTGDGRTAMVNQADNAAHRDFVFQNLRDHEGLFGLGHAMKQRQ